MAAMEPARTLKLCIILISTFVLAQKPIPVPTIKQPVLPESVTPLCAPFTFFVGRAGFASSAVVNPKSSWVTAAGYRKHPIKLILRARTDRWPWGTP
jgi:hypothetical protein